jgi:hypothetical protein
MKSPAKVAPSPRLRALDWVLQTTSEEPKRPKHLRACAKQMRELEYRIRETERMFQEKVGKLYKLVVVQNNTVYIDLPEALQVLSSGLAFLDGLRVAYRVLCGEKR